MRDDDIRGVFMGYQCVLGALISTHPDLAALKAALDDNSRALLRSSEKQPDAMLHPAEKTISMFDDHIARLQRQRDQG